MHNSPVAVSTPRAWTVRLLPLFGAALLAMLLISAMRLTSADVQATAPARPVAQATLGVTRYISTTGLDSGTCATRFSACRTLQYAVDQARAGDSIRIARGVYAGVVNRSGGNQMARIPVSVTIAGGYDPLNFDGAPNPVIHPVVLTLGGAGRGLVVTNGAIVTVRDLSISGGSGVQGGGNDGNGGAILVNSADLTLNNVALTNNSAASGGALALVSGSANLLGVTLTNNQAVADGGAIHLSGPAAGSTVQIDAASLLEQNSAGNNGGAIALVNGTLTVSGAPMRNNVATASGGALYIAAGTATLNGVTVQANSAGGDGGAAVLNGGQLRANGNTLFTLNTANNGRGSAFFANNAQIFVNGSTITAQAGQGDGGVVYLQESTLNLTNNSVFSQNSATGAGAIFAESNSTVLFDGFTAQQNSANRGGLLRANGGQVTVRNSQLISNSAATDGGALAISAATLTIENSTLSSNQADGNGGAFTVQEGTLQVTGSTFSQNQAGGDGGAAHILTGTLTLADSNWLANLAGGDGGALYGFGSSGSGGGGRFEQNRTLTAGSGGAIFWEGPSLAFDRVVAFTGNLAGVTVTARARSAAAGNSAADTVAAAFAPQWLSLEELTARGLVRNGRIEITPDMVNAAPGMGMGALMELLQQPMPEHVGQLPGAAVDSTLAVAAPRGRAVTASTVITTDVVSKSGGAIYSRNVILSLTVPTFNGNQADVAGGALFVEGGNFVLTNATLNNNRAFSGPGGGVYLNQVSGSVDNSTFSANHGSNGGGVYARGGQLIFDANTLRTNRADVDGGGIFLWGGAHTVSGSTVEANVGDRGGGIYLDGGSMTVTRNTIQDNETTFVRTQARGTEVGIGVGMYVSGTKELSFTHNLVQRNKIPFRQYIRENGRLTETKVITVVDPPVILCITPTDPSCIIMESVVIADNGGGLFLREVEGLVADSIFRENEASRSGGAITMDGGKLTLIDNLMVRNSIGVSTGLGSAVYMSGTKASLLHNTIADNIHQNLTGDGRNVAVYYNAKGSGLVLTNNIFANHEVGVAGADGAEALESANVWWNHSERHWGEELFEELSPIFGDPAFRNPAAGDYSILRTSAGYNRGVDLPDVGAEFALIDLAGERRLEPVDVGAYEYNYSRGLNLFHTASNLNLAKDLETTYVVTVLNNGRSTVPGVTFQYSLPPQQQALSISSTRGGCNVGSLSCNLGTFNIGEQATISIRARAVVEATPGQIREMQSTATINFAGLDPNDSDRALALTTYLQALVLGDLAVTRDGTPVHTGACAVKLVTEERGTTYWPSVQDAINRVLLGSDRILVSGTCLGSLNLQNNKNMLIQGGWSTDFRAHNPALYPTTLRATSGNVVTVRNEGIEPRIYDVTLTGGNAARGGGVYIVNASPVFSNVTILGNRANTQGGGVYVDAGSKPTFVDSRIENNSASVAGAGVYINTGSGKFEKVRVSANTGATDGGGFYFRASDAQVIGSQILTHSVSGYGGGVYMSFSRAQVLDTLIQNNSSGSSGGGVYAFKSPATLQFNRIVQNRTSAGEMNFVPFIFDLALVERRGGGGGIYAESSDIRILNNYIAKNSAGASSGHVGVGIHMWLFDAPEVSGNMIVDNQGNGVYMRQRRSIFKFFILLPPLMPPPFSPELILPLTTPPPAKLYHNTIARNSGVGVYGYSQTNLELANNLIWENGGGGVRLGEEIIPHLIVVIVPGFGFFIPIPIIYPTFYPPEATADFTFWGASPSFSTSGAFTDSSQSNDFAGENPAFQDPNNGNYHLKRISLAFQNAKTSGQSQDIDGDERKQGLKPDIGADEYSFRRTRYATVGGTTAAGDHLCLDWKQPCTLQTAIDSAEDGDLIKVAGYTDGRAYSTIINRDGHNTVAIVRKNITIQGGYCETTVAQSGVMQCDWENPHPATYKTVLNANGAGRGLTIETDKGMQIYDVHITGGNATLGGGLYVISSTAVLSNVEIFGNQATRGGGAYFVGSKAVMVNSQVHDNSASQGGGLYMDSASQATFHLSSLTNNQASDGGAVFANGSKSQILDNVITGNRADKDGGAFYLVDSAIAVERNRVESNNAQRGGGFFLSTGEPSVISNTVTLNQAAVDGGGFYLNGGAGVVQQNIVTANSANGQSEGAGRGGGAYLQNTKVNFKENQVRQNTARTGGGLHLFAASEAILDGNQVTDNVAALDGGGFHLDASASILLNNVVTGNRARNGGGFYLFNFSAAQLANTTVLSNTASEDGGGFYFRLSNAGLNGALIRANSGRSGGAIFAKLSKLTLTDVHAERNQAAALGGAFYLDESDSTIFDNNVYTNTAALDGGGVYILRSGGALLVGIDVQGNQAGGNGGGLFLSDSNISLTGKRLAANRATGNGGGLYADKSDITFAQFLVRGNQAVDGAGILLSNGSDADMSSNAFVDNIASGRGGGLALQGSSPKLVQTTFARNQGGEAVYVDVFGPVSSLASFLNTLFADQPVALSLTEKTSATLTVNLWHNVDTRWNGPAEAALGEVNIEDDPLFAADGYHLLKDSPAINEGAKTTASKDIDGEAIPQSGVPDIGADEFPVPCAAQIERNPDRTYTSVQAAVDAAEPGDLIKLAGLCREVTERNGVRQVLYLDKNVTLRGGYDPDDWTISYPLTQVTSIQPITTARSIFIGGGVQPLIESVTIQGGSGSGQGGGPDGQDAGGNLFIVDASPVFSNTVIRDGGSVVYGGGGFLLRSDARFITNTVTTNSAVAGAGFFLSSSTATFDDNVFERNGASKDGGAFFLNSSTAQILANTFKQNSAGTAGGAIFADASAATVTGNRFDQNQAGSAGAIYLDFSPAQVVRNHFTGNKAQSAGGVMIAYSDAIFDGNYLFENSALNGGGVYVESSAAQIINNMVISNTAASSGSGVYVLSASPQLTHNTFLFNNGGDGSAISVQATGGAQSVVPLLNNIIAFHELGVFVLNGGSVTANATLWFGNETDAGSAPTNPSGFSEGALRLTSDPLFADLNALDFRLSTSSPAREAALASNVDHDWEGHPRPTDTAADIGADEYFRPEMVLSALASPDPLVAGQPGFLTFQIANTGNVALTAQVTATLPTALGGNEVEVWTALIPVGQTWAESVALQIPAELRGEVGYTLEVTTSEGTRDRLDGTVTVTPPNFGLVTTIARTPQTVILGRPVSYELTADNTGNQLLSLLVTATLPVQATPSGVVTWTVDLDGGERWRETITLTPTTVAPNAEITFRLEMATSDGSVSIVENNTTTIGQPGYILAQTVTPNPPLMGRPFTITALITNTGNVALQTALTVTVVPDFVGEPITAQQAIEPGQAVVEHIALPANSYLGPLTSTLALAIDGVFAEERSLATTAILAPLGPTIVAVNSGPWNSPNTWQPARLPNGSDIVGVLEGRTVQLTGPVAIAGLQNSGVIVGPPGGAVSLAVAGEVQNFGEIRAVSGADNSGEAGRGVELTAKTIYNAGTILAGNGADNPQGRGGDGGSVTVHTDLLNNQGVIRAGNGGNGSSDGGSGGAVNVAITAATGELLNAGEIRGGNGGNGNNGAGGAGGPIAVTGPGAATPPLAQGGGDVIVTGVMQAGNGGDGATAGGDGGAVRLDVGVSADPATLPGGAVSVSADGLVRGGDGGNVRGSGNGGTGGPVNAIGLTVDVTGVMRAGNGGNVQGTGAGNGGAGGAATVIGGAGGAGAVKVRDNGLVRGGDGGSGNAAATAPQNGGGGGDVTVMASPTVEIADGQVIAGNGGAGTGGGVNGQDGDVLVSGGDGNTTDVPTILIVGLQTQISGQDITIFGGDGLLIILSGLNGGALEANGVLTLAVGGAGQIDLRGNAVVIFASGQIRVFVEAQGLKLSAGVTLGDLASTPPVVGGSRILYLVQLLTPPALLVRPGEVVLVPVVVTNLAPVADSYRMASAGRAAEATPDWTVSSLPPLVPVKGTATARTVITVTVPSTALVGSVQRVGVTAISFSDAQSSAEGTTRLIVSGEPLQSLYLPLIGDPTSSNTQQGPEFRTEVFLPRIGKQ